MFTRSRYCCAPVASTAVELPLYLLDCTEMFHCAVYLYGLIPVNIILQPAG